jgi:hypothetical protein
VVKCRPGYIARPNPAAAGGYPRTNVPVGTYTCTDVRLVGTWRGVPPVCVGMSFIVRFGPCIVAYHAVLHDALNG